MSTTAEIIQYILVFVVAAFTLGYHAFVGMRMSTFEIMTTRYTVAIYPPTGIHVHLVNEREHP